MAFTAEEWYGFWKLGDVNLDGKINDKDLDLISDFIGKWHPSCDINEDQLVNEEDLQIAASHYGLDIWSYYGVIQWPSWLSIALILGVSAFLVVGVYTLTRKRD